MITQPEQMRKVVISTEDSRNCIIVDFIKDGGFEIKIDVED